MLWFVLGGFFVTLVTFWVEGKDLPARVGCLEMKQVKIDQFKEDLTDRLDRIEKKIDDLSK